MRVGIGYDAHAFDAERALVLGGVLFEGAPGLAGWSDGDVLTHAIIDALLGAAGLGDLGDHFPAESVSEGGSSTELLAKTLELIDRTPLRIGNIDCVVVAQEVRIKPNAHRIVQKLSSVLHLMDGQLSVKGTTTDRLGFSGREEGIAAMAVVLLTD